MAGCEAWVYEKGRQGQPLRGRPCAMRALVKTPPSGMDLRPNIWLCAYHAPVKLLQQVNHEHRRPR